MEVQTESKVCILKGSLNHPTTMVNVYPITEDSKNIVHTGCSLNPVDHTKIGGLDWARPPVDEGGPWPTQRNLG